MGLSQQLAREFRQKIETGQWAPGARLPTTRALAAEYSVSINTIQNAFRELEAHNLVSRHPRRGGFVTSRRANGSRSRRASTVAIVGPNVADDDPHPAKTWPYWIIRAAENSLAAPGYHISLLSASPDEAPGAMALLPRIEHLQNDLLGLICFPMAGMEQLLRELDRLELPWVTINRLHPRATDNFVIAENFEGGRIVGKCFARAGYDRIVYLGHVMTPGSSVMDKFLGFVQGYVEEGMPSSAIDFASCDSIFEDAGYEALARYISKHGPPRGVFASGDYQALGALRLCRERGWPVPEQVGIVGATGLEVGEFVHPSLTVLAQPMREMGVEAARMLVAMHGTGQRRCGGKFIPSPLIIRESFVMPSAVLRDLGVTVQE